MKVLIVKVSALGDIVHALPVLAWVKSAGSEIVIDWLVEEPFAPLLEGHPLLNRVHRIATRKWRQQGWIKSAGEGMRMIGLLRRQKYDLVLDLQGNSKSGLFTAFCGAPRRFGFDRGGVREWPNLLATNRRVSLTTDEYHISERSLALARAAFPAGTDHQMTGPLPIQPDAARQVETSLAEHGLTGRHFAILHYGTTWPTKLWSVDNWQKLVRLLLEETTLTPVLTWGNPEERAVVEQIAAVVDGRAVIWPRGTLSEMAALLARAAVVVGGDTGPIHVAAAVGAPTVSIYRATDKLRNGPRGDRHFRLQAPLHCSPCLHKSCEQDNDCRASIAADEVLSALVCLLGEESVAVKRT
jgi:heptosyltransferase-1